MKTEDHQVSVAVRDVVGFVAYAAVLIVIAVGLYAVAPSKAGQVLGVAVALVLLPVPLVVAYFSRRRVRRTGR